MKEQLRNDLLEHLGELMNDREQQRNWHIKRHIETKINAINYLLHLAAVKFKDALNLKEIVLNEIQATCKETLPLQKTTI